MTIYHADSYGCLTCQKILLLINHFLAMNRIFLLFSTALLLSSCIVSKKKYDDLLAQKVRMEADLADRDTALHAANNEIASLEQALAQLREDTAHLGIDLRKTSTMLAGLEREHQQLNANYRNLLTSSGRLN